jgi:hypothetical protein
MRKWSVALLMAIISGYVAQGGDRTSHGEQLSPAPAATPRPSIDLDALLASVPRGTTWASLDPTIKQTLQDQAVLRMAAFDEAWGRLGLKRKLRSLRQHHTQESEAQFNLFVSKRYASVVPPSFVATRDIRSKRLLRVLQSQYILTYGVFRGMMHNLPTFGMNDRDWDGVGRLDAAVGVPNERTLTAQRIFAARVLRKLRDIGDSQLTSLERNVRDRAKYILRALVQRTLETSYGIDLTEAAHYRPILVSGFALAYSGLGGALYESAAAFLQDVNAAWFGPTKWVDTATVNTVANFTFRQGAARLVLIGDPSVSPLAKNYELLASWWLERLKADPRAGRPCTIYTERERAALWRGFAASSLLENSPGSSLVSLNSLIANERQLILADYQQNIIPAALRTVFPDESIITLNQRAEVISALSNDPRIGAYPALIADALDSVTGDGLASTEFRKTMNGLAYIGGVATAAQITATDRARVAKVWDDVRAFLIGHYSGGTVDFGQTLPTGVLATADVGSFADPTTGAIICGLGSRRSLGALYSTLLHEAHHAMNFRTGHQPEGLGLEGIATLAARMLERQLLAEALPNKAPLYSLEQGAEIGRLFGATEGNIAVLIRDHCDAGAPNGIEFARQFGLNWGLTGPEADVVALRANNGTQYLQYLAGAALNRDVLSYLQTAVGSQVTLDPFRLMYCNVWSARKDQATIDALAACR